MESFIVKPKEFVSKFNEYLKNINEKPINEGRLLWYAERNRKEFIKIQASLANDRISRQVKEFIAAGLAEEIGIDAPEEIDPYDDDFYNSNLDNGYRIQSVPVYSDSLEITSHRFLRTNAHPNVERQRVANDINIRYEKEDDTKFSNEQEAKESFLQQKVSSGEMTFIGEMSFDDYIALRKMAPDVTGKNFELIPCFESDKKNWTERRKVYAYKEND